MRRPINATLAIAMLAIATPHANAQDALGTGNALDRNPNTLSGGRNRANRSVFAEVELRNALVTGNVGGGARFRGNLGYTAPRDFRGDTGSGDIFDFVADSFYSGLATQNLRNLGGVRNAFSRPTLGQIGSSTGSFILERPTTTGGNIASIDPQNESPGGVADTQGGSSNARIDPFNRLNGTLRSTSGYLIKASESPEILNLRQPQTPNEFPSALVASPLQGVKPISVVNPSLGYEQLSLEPLGSISDTIGDPDATDGEEPREGQVDPHRMIVSKLTERIENIRDTEQENEIDGKIDDEATDEPRPLGMQSPFNADDPARMPTTTELLDALRESFTENAPEFSTMPKDADIPGTRPSEDDEEEDEPESPFLSQRIIDNAVKAMGGDAIVIDKLVNENRAPSTFKDHMLTGQDMLAKGRWFDAEERFTAALQARPDAPLASAGRVNAQVGAGMYRSAALNLRALYRTYPEMLNVRFDPALLPGADRLESIRAQLRERSRKDTAFARDAGLILAYLGYQFENGANIEEGFGIINRVNEALSVDGDPLDIALERVWTE